MSDVQIYIEPVAPWSRQDAANENRRRNLMTMPGSRDVDTGVPVVPIDPHRPCGRVYQPDLHLPPYGGHRSGVGAWVVAAIFGFVAGVTALCALVIGS